MRPLLLAVLLVGASAGPVAARIPNTTTPAAKLSTSSLTHTELLRIRRDFGKAHFQIALDAWVSQGRRTEIADVRLWWVRTNRNDERGPFGTKTQRHFELEYKRLARDRWDVHLSSGRKVFTFNVELDRAGDPHAYATVVRSDGHPIKHCRTTRSQLVARRFLGAPIGIGKVLVSCVDDQGNEHRGRVAYRKARRRG